MFNVQPNAQLQCPMSNCGNSDPNAGFRESSKIGALGCTIDTPRALALLCWPDLGFLFGLNFIIGLSILK